MSQPQISLVTGTAGRVEELARLGASLAAQTLQEFEWIIVDQNKDDRLEGLLKEEVRDMTIRRLRCTPNLSVGLNLGGDAAKAPIIGFPDDDCWFDSGLLISIVALFADHPDWDGMVCRIVDEEGRQAISSWPARSSLCNRFNAWFRVAGTGLFLRREAFKALGGFDPTLGLGDGLFLAAHDLDLVLRALEVGMQIQYVGEAVVRHPQMLRRTSKSHQQKAFSYAIGAGRLMRDHRMPFWWVCAAVLAPLLRTLLAAVRLQGTSAGVHAREAIGRLCGWAGAGGGRQNALLSFHGFLIASHRAWRQSGRR